MEDTATPLTLLSTSPSCQQVPPPSEILTPAANWMRDQSLGGLGQLQPVFNYLFRNNLFPDALQEKSNANTIYQQVK
jgi:hypothetical protein